MTTELERLVMSLIEANIPVILRPHEEHGVCAAFENGFYKSDGMAYLYCKHGECYLRTRYDQVDKVSNIDDIASVSKDWHEYSKDRFDGWITPPENWAALYALFDS